MSYLIPLTISQAAYAGGMGCLCLGLSYILMQGIERIDKIARSHIESIKKSSIDNQAPISNRASTLSDFIKKIATPVTAITMILFTCFAFLLWGVGTGCIIYAAIGPLLI